MLVVNLSTQNYRRAQQRLKISLINHPNLMFDTYPPECPTHQVSPYEFKIHAIRQALKIDPIVLWVDSSMYLVGDLSKIENIIKQDGYFFEEAGHYAGRWTNAHTRNYFNVTDEEMKQDAGGITMFSAGLLGLNGGSPLAMGFLKHWNDSAKAGCFRGGWDDHRHDMTCASIIATRFGMKYQRGGSHLAYIGEGYSKPEDGVVFHCRGMV